MRLARRYRAIKTLFLWGVLLPTLACRAQAAPLKPSDLLAAPAKYLNRPVEIEIVESLDGPVTPQALATNEYQQYRIQIPEAVAAQISIVTPAFRLNDPNRYKKKFDRVITSPLLLRGEFLSDEDLAKQSNRPAYVIRLASWEPLAEKNPEAVPSLATLKADPARYDRKLVVYEGVYKYGFETSALDGEIWLAVREGATIVGILPRAPGKPAPRRVRVTGILFAKPGAYYGHLGGYRFQILASKVEYLDPVLP